MNNFFFKSVQIYMKDAECDETKEKSIFWFLFFALWGFLVIFVLKSPQFSMNIHDISININRKIDFSFDSVLSASFIKTGAKLHILSLENAL